MHAYCINLEKRADRRETAGAEFEREGLDVEFFPATDGRVDTPAGLYVNPAEYGCSMSHTRVWRDMVEKGYEMALVFEDDVCLTPHFKTKLDELLKEVAEIHWDIIHLGPLLPIIKQHITPLIYEGQPLGTHAYLISLECAKKIAPFDASLMKVSVDFQLNRFPLKILCVNEQLAKQVSIEDAPLIGLMKSAFEGDIGLERTYDLNYFIRYGFQRFGILIGLFVAFIVLILTRN
jgi:GR25 family glycosyltransferase involved in LPS biosynthesis